MKWYYRINFLLHYFKNFMKNPLDKETIELQRRLDLIQYWLKETTEPIWDWDWDGEELVIFQNRNTVERYSNYVLKEVIE
jgi:hypothetical protein